MKLEEAIAEIRESGLYGNQVHVETLELALEALEKQIHKKVIIERNGAKRCPSCGVKHFNPKWKPEVCDCTQKLDWSEEDGIQN